MKVTVKLFATLAKGRFEEEVREYEPATTVRHVLSDLGIPEAHAKIVFVNNRHAGMDSELLEGDMLGIFPPIGGG